MTNNKHAVRDFSMYLIRQIYSVRQTSDKLTPTPAAGAIKDGFITVLEEPVVDIVFNDFDSLADLDEYVVKVLSSVRTNKDLEADPWDLEVQRGAISAIEGVREAITQRLEEEAAVQS